MECPKCKKTVEYIPDECEICPECGAELVPSPEKETAKTDVFADVDFPGVFSKIKDAGKTGADDWNLSNRSKEMADKIETKEFEPDEKSECPYLDVEYNRNLFFLSGSEAVMKLRLTPKSRDLRHILIFMETLRSGNNSRRQIPVTEILQNRRSFFIQVPYHPEQVSGRLSFAFYIGCKTERELNYYQFTVEHKVYAPDQSGSSLSRQVIINTNFTASGAGTIDTSIKANQAGTVNYRNTVEEAIRQMGKEPSVHELIDRLNDLPPVFERKSLTATTWRPEDVLVKGNPQPGEKLLLEWNGFSIFLLGRNCVKFGRDPEKVDLLVRSGGGKIGPREYPNSTVSRFHAEVLYCEDTVKFFDHSSYGTYINGRKPDSAGIPIQDKALIEFGDIHWQMNMQNCEIRSSRNICQSCVANKIKSMTFKRTDEEKECYLLVWQCCELGLVFEELSDWNVFFRNGSFFIRTPDQDFYYLRSGQTIESKGQKVQVKYFRQD